MWKRLNVHVIEGGKRKKGGKKAGFLPDARLGWRNLPRVARGLYSHGERRTRLDGLAVDELGECRRDQDGNGGCIHLELDELKSDLFIMTSTSKVPDHGPPCELASIEALAESSPNRVRCCAPLGPGRISVGTARSVALVSSNFAHGTVIGLRRASQNDGLDVVAPVTITD